MEIIAFTIPFIVALVLLIFFHKRTAWWEYLLVIVPSILFVIVCEAIFRSDNSDDVEYLGTYITKIRHYDRWNEYIHRTCTREVPNGKDSEGHTKYRTETYDCSYVEDHPERWAYFTNDGQENYFIGESEYDRVKEKFGTEPQFVDMNRDYYTIDGDAQDTYWNNSIQALQDITISHKYNNPIKSSRSVFKFEDISDEEADSLGLFRYPDIEEYEQDPVLGVNYSQYQKQFIKYLNAFYGRDKQFRMYLLFFKDKPEEIVEKQRSYWQGGNKNELVVCVGYHKSGKSIKVDWANAFSWEDKPVLSVKARDWFLSNRTPDLSKFKAYIEPYIQSQWKKKQFKDFSYVTVEISDTQYKWMLIFLTIYNIGIGLWVIFNEFTESKPSGETNKLNY